MSAGNRYKGEDVMSDVTKEGVNGKIVVLVGKHIFEGFPIVSKAA